MLSLFVCLLPLAVAFLIISLFLNQSYTVSPIITHVYFIGVHFIYSHVYTEKMNYFFCVTGSTLKFILHILVNEDHIHLIIV